MDIIGSVNGAEKRQLGGEQTVDISNMPSPTTINYTGDTVIAKQQQYKTNAFTDILNGALDIAANVVTPGLGTIDNFSSLMQQQMLWQIEMQYYTAESNISKSKHEVAMAPIRNLRVG